ncbi:unnamed protein product, partial [Rotaria sp. Silwood2]
PDSDIRLVELPHYERVTDEYTDDDESSGVSASSSPSKDRVEDVDYETLYSVVAIEIVEIERD